MLEVAVAQVAHVVYVMQVSVHMSPECFAQLSVSYARLLKVCREHSIQHSSTRTSCWHTVPAIPAVPTATTTAHVLTTATISTATAATAVVAVTTAATATHPQL
jgi:hypothetical protein